MQEAKAAPKGSDVRLADEWSTIRQYLQAGLVDKMHLAIVPVLLGSGGHLLSGLDLPALGYEPTEQVSGASAMHVTVTRRGQA